MSAPYLAEGSVNLVLNHIKGNIAQALSDVRTARADAIVTTEPPVSYFIYEHAKGFKTPVVFVICDKFDFNLSNHKANFIDAIARVRVSILVEDRDKERLTRKAFRYQSALHQVLAFQPLLSADQNLKLNVTVTDETFSPIYSRATNATAGDAVWAKEVLLECDVYHRENF